MGPFFESDAENRPFNGKSARGRYYVNGHCLDHDLCRSIAPNLFQRDNEHGCFYVVKQPETPKEFQLMEECIESCPMAAIRDDGDTFKWPSSEA